MRCVTLMILLAFEAEAQSHGLRMSQQRPNLPPVVHPIRASQVLSKPPLLHHGFPYSHTSHRSHFLAVSRAEEKAQEVTQELPLEQQQRPIGELCSEEDLKQASEDLSGVTPGDIMGIERSDGSWRYAVLLQGDVVVTFEVDQDGSIKEFSGQTEEVRALKPSEQERIVGEVCKEEDLQEASSDLSGVNPGDIAAILRSDNSWKYGKLLEGTVYLKFQVDTEGSIKELPSENVRALSPKADVLDEASPSVTSISVAALINVLAVAGTGVTFAICSFYRRALTLGEQPLLVI